MENNWIPVTKDSLQGIDDEQWCLFVEWNGQQKYFESMRYKQWKEMKTRREALLLQFTHWQPIQPPQTEQP